MMWYIVAYIVGVLLLLIACGIFNKELTVERGDEIVYVVLGLGILLWPFTIALGCLAGLSWGIIRGPLMLGELARDEYEVRKHRKALVKMQQERFD